MGSEFMKRNYGIDLLRMVLMFMVVILHTLGHGGIIEATEPLSSQYITAWLIRAFAFCAVNCYAIITGYVYYNSRYKVSSILLIYLQGLLYSVGIAACVWIIKPEYFSLGSLIIRCLPISSNGYWYLSAYVGLFVIIALLNLGIRGLTERQVKMFLIASFIFFTVLPALLGVDPFGVNNGYSTFWLAYLYVVGACIKKYNWGEKFSGFKAMLIYVGAILITWGWKMGWEGITTRFSIDIGSFIKLLSYISPTMLIASIALFFAFKNIKISPKAGTVISIFSPNSDTASNIFSAVLISLPLASAI